MWHAEVYGLYDLPSIIDKHMNCTRAVQAKKDTTRQHVVYVTIVGKGRV